MKSFANGVVTVIATIMFIIFFISFLAYYIPTGIEVQAISPDVNQPFVIWVGLIGSTIFLFKSLWDSLNNLKPY